MECGPTMKEERSRLLFPTMSVDAPESFDDADDTMEDGRG